MGKEWKRKGTQTFRRQEFQAAINNYSQAVEQCPWDISLYTNLALVSRNDKGRHYHIAEAFEGENFTNFASHPQKFSHEVLGMSHPLCDQFNIPRKLSPSKVSHYMTINE